MLPLLAPHPTDFHTLRFLYPIGNTPPKLLTRFQPSDAATSDKNQAGSDASAPFACLLLGCGDLRHVLWTSYCTVQQALAKAASASISPTASAPPLGPVRGLDVTMCDIEPAIHARNIILALSAWNNSEAEMASASASSSASASPSAARLLSSLSRHRVLWSLFYDHFIDAATARAIRSTLASILAVVEEVRGEAAAVATESSPAAADPSALPKTQAPASAASTDSVFESTCVRCGASYGGRAHSDLCLLCRWNQSELGRHFQFCDSRSLERVVAVWRAYDAMLQQQLSASAAAQRSFLAQKHSLRRALLTEFRGDGNVLSMDLLQGAAPAIPCFLEHVEALGKSSEIYVQHGFFDQEEAEQGGAKPVAKERAIVNPLFFVVSATDNGCSVAAVSERYNVHYATNPLASYTIAEPLLAYHKDSKKQREADPLHKRLVRFARLQFAQRCDAMVQLMRANKITMRLVVGDVLEVCRALSQLGASSDHDRPLPMHLPIGDLRPLCLDGMGQQAGDKSARSASSSSTSSVSQAPGKSCSRAPLLFHFIDSSNLSDHIGMLALLLATEPLLHQDPCAVLQTDVLLPRNASSDRSDLLAGHSLLDPSLCAALIGLVPSTLLCNFSYSPSLDAGSMAGMLAADMLATQVPGSFTWSRPNSHPKAGTESIASLSAAIPLERVDRASDGSLCGPVRPFRYRMSISELLGLIVSLHNLLRPSIMEKFRKLETSSAAEKIQSLRQMNHYTEHTYIALLRHVEQRQGVELTDGSWAALHAQLVPTLSSKAGDMCVGNRLQSLWMDQAVLRLHSTPPLSTDPVSAAAMVLSSMPHITPHKPDSAARSLPSVVRAVHLIPWHSDAGIKLLRERRGTASLIGHVRTRKEVDNFFSALHTCFVRVVHRTHSSSSNSSSSSSSSSGSSIGSLVGATPSLPATLGCWRHGCVSCSVCFVWSCSSFALESTDPSDPAAMWCVSFLIPTYLTCMAPPSVTRISMGLASDGAGSTSRDLVAQFGLELEISGGMLTDTHNTALCWEMPRTFKQMRNNEGQTDTMQAASREARMGQTIDAGGLPLQLVLTRPASGPARLSALQCTFTPAGPLAALFQAGCSVSVEQHLSSSLTLRFGSVSGAGLSGGVRHLFFPLPVDLSRVSVKVSRKSGTVEVTAPLLALAVQREGRWTDKTQIVPLNPFPLQCTIDSRTSAHQLAARWSPSLPLPLDQCPLVDPRSNAEWLYSLFGSMLTMHASEKAAVTAHSHDGLGLPGFSSLKESLHCLAMPAIGRTHQAIYDSMPAAPFRAFGLSCPGKGGINIILVLHGIRLLESLDSVALDCSVCALEMAFTREVGSCMQAMSDRFVQVKVTPSELVLWKYLLPRACEWAAGVSSRHKPTCDYAKASNAIPLSVAEGARPYCTCHRGVNLPAALTNAQSPMRSISRWFTRAALLPLFAPPHAKSFLDDMPAHIAASVTAQKQESQPAAAKQTAVRSASHSEAATAAPAVASSSSASSAASSSSSLPSADVSAVCCAFCSASGSAVTLKRCSACRAVAYCSPDHQRLDWKNHKASCKSK